MVTLSDDLHEFAIYYLSWKSTLELKHFVDKKRYMNIHKEIDQVLYYSGRIPSDYILNGYPELCDVAVDLSKASFCVPVMNQYSPLPLPWRFIGTTHMSIIKE